MSLILLDTHAAIWGVDGSLAKEATRAVSEAAAHGELLISPISAWEIGTLVRKGRLALGKSVQDYVRMLFTQPGVVTAALTPAIAAEATSLPGSLHGDPVDRILVATAAALGAHLITRDRKLHEYARATRYIRCLPC